MPNGLWSGIRPLSPCINPNLVTTSKLLCIFHLIYQGVLNNEPKDESIGIKLPMEPLLNNGPSILFCCALFGVKMKYCCRIV